MRPRENPAIGELRGRLIRLRPFQPEEIEYAWQGLALQDEAAHPRRTREDWRAQPSDRFRRRLTRSGKFWRGCLDLAIEREAKLIGDIQARTSPTQTLPNGVFEVGVILHQTEDRGKGYGREAVELLTGWLFAVAGAERVQASTDVANSAMRSVLEALGFCFEGVMRALGSRSDGSRIDGAMYAIIRSDWVNRSR